MHNHNGNNNNNTEILQRKGWVENDHSKFPH